jgi:PEP-CTERM motif
MERMFPNRNCRGLVCATSAAVILGWGVVPARAANLVQNPGFETGSFSSWTVNLNGTDPSTTFVHALADAGSPYPAHSGTYEANFGATGAQAFISQTLTTTPGQLYQIDFFVFSDGGTPNEFSASFGGVTLLDLTNIPVKAGQADPPTITNPATSADYVEHTLTATAAGASTTLQFGGRNDVGFLLLDDVSVTAVTPEPASLGLLSLGGLGLLARRRN